VLVGIAAVGGLREVDLDHVERRALEQLGALRGVDHVVGRRDHILERAHRRRLV